MYCLQFLEKVIGSNCLPDDNQREQEQPRHTSQPQHPAPKPQELLPMHENNSTYITPSQRRRKEIQQKEDEDMFKDIAPSYVAPKRIGQARFTKDRSNDKFAMDDQISETLWETHDIDI